MIYLYHSGMLGAPQLTQVAGAGLDVLDVLVTGFGAGTVDSVVVANGIATVTRSGGHPFEPDAVSLIAGAATTALNGAKKVLGATPTAYTFAAPGVADQTAAGSITHKVAPAGWLKTAGAAANSAYYKSGSPEATGCYLYVDDAAATAMQVAGFEEIGGSSKFPGAGGFWPKSQQSQAAPWCIVADERYFYLWIKYSADVGVAVTMSFGDFVSNKSPDAWACAIACVPSAYSVSAAEDSGYVGGGSILHAARTFTGLGGSCRLVRGSAVPASNSGGNGPSGTFGMPFPNGPDNKMYVSGITLGDWLHGNYRGDQPGSLALCHPDMRDHIQQAERIDDLAGYEGRRFIALSNGAGVFLVDLTGPWR